MFNWSSKYWPANICRYNINGFVEELPQLPENRYSHSCAALPSNGVRLDLDQPLKPFQAYVVAGGYDGNTVWGPGNELSSVMTLLPGAAAWTPVASLPRRLERARASVAGRMRIVGGFSSASRSEVIFAYPLKQWSFVWQVLEYHPAPWDQWVTVGNIQASRYNHAVLSIGPQQLPCLAGDDKESEEVSISISIEELLLRECQPFTTVFHIIWVLH